MSKTIAIVGNWSFNASDQKGITAYDYDPDTGNLEMIENICPEIASGTLWPDEENGVVYVCDERGERRGEVGGGGYIYAFRVDRVTGKLSLINEKGSLAPEPSYICVDKSGKYLLVSNHVDPWHVTRIIRKEDGTFENKVLFDDAGLSLFRINPDGSVGDMCDFSVTQSSDGRSSDSKVEIDPVSGHMQCIRVMSRVHCVVPNQTKEIYVACDKGMDCVYTYRVDEENGKLIQLDRLGCDYSVSPRYAVFNLQKPVIYVNHELDPGLDAIAYDPETGKMSSLKKIPLLFEDPGFVDGKPVGAQDIVISADGKMLYCSMVGINSISVCSLDEDGIPELTEEIPCGGIMPRALQFSPDGKYLYSGNMLSGDITLFKAGEDGHLTDTGTRIPAVSPSAIRFMTL